MKWLRVGLRFWLKFKLLIVIPSSVALQGIFIHYSLSFLEIPFLTIPKYVIAIKTITTRINVAKLKLLRPENEV